MKQIYRLFVFVFLSLLVIEYAAARGNISGGRYQSPLNNFTVAVPNWTGNKIQDENDKGGGRVSFHDDFGNLQAITYLKLSEIAEATFKDNKKRDVAYSDFLNGFAFPVLFHPVSKDTKVIHKEFLGEGEDRFYFVVVSIPEGSFLKDLKQNKRLDSVRGLLIFSKQGFMYMVETEMNSVFSMVDPSSLKPKQLELSQSTLKKIKDSMVFK